MGLKQLLLSTSFFAFSVIPFCFFYLFFIHFFGFAFSALILLAGRQEEHLACKN